MNKERLEKILLLGAVFLAVAGGLLTYRLVVVGRHRAPSPATGVPSVENEEGEPSLPEEGSVQEKDLELEQLPESENTPEEIDNSALTELDTLVGDLTSDPALDDSLSDLDLE